MCGLGSLHAKWTWILCKRAGFWRPFCLVLLLTWRHTFLTSLCVEHFRISESQVGYAIIRHAPLPLSNRKLRKLGSYRKFSTARIATDTEKQQSQTDRKGKIVIAVCLQRLLNNKLASAWFHFDPYWSSLKTVLIAWSYTETLLDPSRGRFHRRVVGDYPFYWYLQWIHVSVWWSSCPVVVAS